MIKKWLIALVPNKEWPEDRIRNGLTLPEANCAVRFEGLLMVEPKRHIDTYQL